MSNYRRMRKVEETPLRAEQQKSQGDDTPSNNAMVEKLPADMTWCDILSGVFPTCIVTAPVKHCGKATLSETFPLLLSLENSSPAPKSDEEE